MSDQLTHAQCERLKEMGLPQEVARHERYWANHHGSFFVHISDHKQTCLQDDPNRCKLPPTDELREFVMTLVKRNKDWTDRNWVVSTESWSNGDYSANFMLLGADNTYPGDLQVICDGSDESNALFTLAEKLDKMIGEKSE